MSARQFFLLRLLKIKERKVYLRSLQYGYLVNLSSKILIEMVATPIVSEKESLFGMCCYSVPGTSQNWVQASSEIEKAWAV